MAKNFFNRKRNWVLIVLFALFNAIYFFCGVTMPGNSGSPTLLNGERLYVAFYETWLAKLGILHFQRGDMVALMPPENTPNLIPGVIFIKRIVGVPGDTLRMEHGQLFINNIKVQETHTVPFWKTREFYDDSSMLASSESWPFRKENTNKDFKLEQNQYFVMGDNRSAGASEDSRVFGPVGLNNLLGRIKFVEWPAFAKVKAEKVGNLTYYHQLDTDYNNKPTENGTLMLRWRTLATPEAFVKLNAQLDAQKK